MDGQTFRSRVIELLQKSKKAVRVYTSMGRAVSSEQSYYSELQVREWKSVNADLLKSLTGAAEADNHRELSSKIFSLRDRYYNDWRLTESELHDKQKALIMAAENGDYIKATLLGQQLVSLKARLQATQAAHHELQDVINKSGITQPVIELSQKQALDIPASAAETGGKVIHLASRKGR